MYVIWKRSCLLHTEFFDEFELETGSSVQFPQTYFAAFPIRNSATITFYLHQTNALSPDHRIFSSVLRTGVITLSVVVVVHGFYQIRQAWAFFVISYDLAISVFRKLMLHFLLCVSCWCSSLPVRSLSAFNYILFSLINTYCGFISSFQALSENTATCKNNQWIKHMFDVVKY